MTQTTTPRDEADALLREVVPVLEAVQRSIQPRYVKGFVPANGVSEDGPLIERIRHYLAKPAGGVDVEAAARDLLADLDRSLVFSKDDRVIAATNASVKRLRASLSPAATPVSEAGPVAATPEMIAAAWAAWHSRHGGKLGPGPGFAEAIGAALALAKAASPADGEVREAEILNRAADIVESLPWHNAETIARRMRAAADDHKDTGHG